MQYGMPRVKYKHYIVTVFWMFSRNENSTGMGTNTTINNEKGHLYGKYSKIIVDQVENYKTDNVASKYCIEDNNGLKIQRLIVSSPKMIRGS